MAEPGYSVLRNNIQAASCNGPNSIYPTSGLVFTPFPALGVGSPLVSCQMIFQFDPDATNSSELSFKYAMSSSNAGTVILALALFQVADGADPNGAPTTATFAAFTPGDDQLQHTLDSSTIAGLALTMTRGTTTYLAISRPIATPGSHPGDWNMITARMNPL